jgi:hypothetical protein
MPRAISVKGLRNRLGVALGKGAPEALVEFLAHVPDQLETFIGSFWRGFEDAGGIDAIRKMNEVMRELKGVVTAARRQGGKRRS